jgi:hypothetical protein
MLGLGSIEWSSKRSALEKFAYVAGGELKHNVVALAKAARALKLPIVVTTTAPDSMWGPTFPELVEALPGIEIIDRSSVDAFDDARVARAIEAFGPDHWSRLHRCRDRV